MASAIDSTNNEDSDLRLRWSGRWSLAHRILAQDFHKWNLVPQWRWAIGGTAELSPVWRAYGVGVLVSTRKVAGVTVHTIGHTEAAYVIDANGFERALFLWPYRAAGVVETLRTLAS